MATSSKLISVQHLVKEYNHGAVHALNDCSLDIRRGEVVAIIGPSGCGSSTNPGPFRPLKEQRRDTPWKAASWTCCGRSPRNPGMTCPASMY